MHVSAVLCAGIIAVFMPFHSFSGRRINSFSRLERVRSQFISSKCFAGNFLRKFFCALESSDGSEAIMLVMDVQLNPLISSSHASATVSSRAELN